MPIIYAIFAFALPPFSPMMMLTSADAEMPDAEPFLPYAIRRYAPISPPSLLFAAAADTFYLL